MKTEKIVWGLVLVFIGLILLLDNFGVIDFYWRVVWRYWPVIFILAGVNMLFSRNESAASNFLKIGITCAVLGFIAYSGIYYRNVSRGWSDDKEPREDRDLRLSDNIFKEDMSPDIVKAELNIVGGATSYRLRDTTSDLFHAGVKQMSGTYSLKKQSRNGVEVLNFNMKERHGNWESDANSVQMSLNQRPVWDINVKLGAGEADLDLTKFKIENLMFEGGAAALKVKLGEPQSVTTVTVKTGISSIEVRVPKSAACQIHVSSGLSAKDFDGFEEMEDGTYATPNFKSAANKIIINLKGGMSDFEVKRY